MRGFAIKGGDLVLGPGGYQEVSGVAKVRQDLNIAVSEPYGCDPYHPKWGSLLDRYVGMPADDQAVLLIRSEISRVVNNYILIQQSVVRADAIAGRRPSYNTAELVSEIASIDILPSFDRFLVKVTLNTVGRQQLVLTTQVTAG